MVSVENILVEFGGFTLLDEISFVINKRDRIALTGRNGAGKSTLLKIIAGVQVPTAGVISMPKDFTVGYLPQVLKITDTCSLQEEAAKAFDHIFALQRQAEAMQQELAEREDYESESYHQLIDRLNHYNDMLEMSGVYQYQSEIEKTLLGLGFKRSDFDRQTSEFSGGWRMRIELAKVLLKRPDLILLDEPTNHLDLQARESLEQALKEFDGTVLFVSHDRYFIQALAGKVLELEGGKAIEFNGNYEEYTALKAEEKAKKTLEKEAEKRETHANTASVTTSYRSKEDRAAETKKRLRIKEIENKISALEEEESEINTALATPEVAGNFALLTEKCNRLENLKAELDSLYEEYETLI